MRPLCQELEGTKEVGGIRIVLSDTETLRIPVKVRLFVADSPARAYLTGTKGHNFHYGCHKCNARMDKFNYPAVKGTTALI